MLSDPHFKICERAIDCNWFYNNEIPNSIAGFNPIADQAYIGRYSQFSSWLKKPNNSARDFNFRDQLMKEVLFAVHDYLHNWAYRLINQIYPKLNFGVGKITSKNFESMAFCHILTEAVATVGLDYWYLSTIELNDIVPVGTTLNALTAKYHESHAKEYLRFNPKLRVQHPSFFKTLIQFYCSGKFIGFDLISLKQSPLIYRWLEHEISYGEVQRSYTRDWLLYLMESPLNIKKKDLERRIAITELWQKNLIDEISEKLWEMVKLEKVVPLPPLKKFGKAWTSKNSGRITDARFFNLNSIGDDFWGPVIDSDLDETGKNYLFRQVVSKYKFKDINQKDIRLLSIQSNDPNFRSIKRILGRYQPIKVLNEENSDLFFLN